MTEGNKEMNKKRILFTGGGTAGHVIVNLALIPIFQKKGWEIDYIGSKDGIEVELISQLDHVTYYPISTGKLRRYMSKENFTDPFRVIKGMFQAWRIIGKRKPSVIFSKGGFVSVPVVFAAKLRRVPTVIHESDYTPGLANKLAIPLVDKVLTTFPETVHSLSEKKAEYVGAVVREELLQGEKNKGFSLTGFTEKKLVMLVIGGSGGSEKINSVVRSSLDRLLERYQVIHICGRDNVDESINKEGYCQFEYVSDELKDIFAITDLVLSRAGANAIFEFLALRIPMLLIPLSLSASRGDQIVNARSFEKKGYAHRLDEEDLTDETLVSEMFRLEKSRPVLLDHMKTYESIEARDRIVELLEQLSS